MFRFKPAYYHSRKFDQICPQLVGRNATFTGRSVTTATDCGNGTHGRFRIDKEAVFTAAIIMIDVSYSPGNVCSGTVA
jgi:hypothetical protein